MKEYENIKREIEEADLLKKKAIQREKVSQSFDQNNVSTLIGWGRALCAQSRFCNPLNHVDNPMKTTICSEHPMKNYICSEHQLKSLPSV